MLNKSLTPEQALAQAAELPYAYIRSLSQVTLGPNPGPADLSELLEARYFGAGQEIRIFPGEDGWSAAAVSEEHSDHVLTEECSIQNSSRFGSSLTLHRIVQFDADGQAYIAATILTDWKGACQNA